MGGRVRRAPYLGRRHRVKFSVSSRRTTTRHVRVELGANPSYRRVCPQSDRPKGSAVVSVSPRAPSTADRAATGAPQPLATGGQRQRRRPGLHELLHRHLLGDGQLGGPAVPDVPARLHAIRVRRVQRRVPGARDLRRPRWSRVRGPAPSVQGGRRRWVRRLRGDAYRAPRGPERLATGHRAPLRRPSREGIANRAPRRADLIVGGPEAHGRGVRLPSHARHRRRTRRTGPRVRAAQRGARRIQHGLLHRLLDRARRSRRLRLVRAEPAPPGREAGACNAFPRTGEGFAARASVPAPPRRGRGAEPGHDRRRARLPHVPTAHEHVAPLLSLAVRGHRCRLRAARASARPVGRPRRPVARVLRRSDAAHLPSTSSYCRPIPARCPSS